MEKLLYSSYPNTFRIGSKSSTFLTRFDPARPGSGPLRRVSSVSFKIEDPSPISLTGSRTFSRFRVESAKGSVAESHLGDSGDGGVDSGKLKAIAVGKFILISVLATTIIIPALAPPALATFQATSLGKTLFRGELLTSAWTGFFAGCLHTLSGPDHLAALAPLAIGRTRMESAAVGALWGCGHDAGQVLFGLLFLLLKDRLHIEILQTWGTVIVGLTLVIIGATGIKEALEAVPAPCVSGAGAGYLEGAVPAPKKKKIGFATFATGIVHGLQPDAMMMVLPALALPSRVAGAAYLGMFLVGTVFAMGGYTAFLGSCNEVLKERVPRITEMLTWASSIFAIVLGLAIVLSKYFGYSLY